QQALAGSPLTVDTSPLAALAVTVGLDLNSPDAAIRIAALPPPRAPQSAPDSAHERSRAAGERLAGQDSLPSHAAHASRASSEIPDSTRPGAGHEASAASEHATATR